MRDGTVQVVHVKLIAFDSTWHQLLKSAKVVVTIFQGTMYVAKKEY